MGKFVDSTYISNLCKRQELDRTTTVFSVDGFTDAEGDTCCLCVEQQRDTGKIIVSLHYEDDTITLFSQDLFSQGRNVTFHKAGETVRYGGMEWVILGEEQGGILAIATKSIGNMPFDEGGKADWKNSSLRRYLNGEFLEKLAGADKLMTFTSDLTADDGGTKYGSSEDKVFLLSDALYRKYRAYIPKNIRWWWTITPWSTNPSYANGERIVDDSGALDYHLADNSRGAVPSLLLPKEALL